ncbi:uncharacterized protein F4822DRAFT_288945 [Hypoxylon trugodes]|uniref:uncharacterized protein n=1 Tax=Hypoxylon trugodes TaxID=326681 RepID=UPI002195C678|nr:uncharacterized protein F4822DRAFT_288945 [Hypoxylon trugodes]KAI1387629.1 hypothetical protein F4822DRAFT_288945 [Hypoxylon trugodes]
MPVGVIRDEHRALAARVNSWVEHLYQQRLLDWDAAGQQGQEPTRNGTQQELLNTQGPGTTVAGARAYETIKRSACFPAIARLYQMGLIGYDDLLTEAVKEDANGATAILSKSFNEQTQRQEITPAFQNEMSNAISYSQFWMHEAELRRTSPKYQQLVQYINHIIDLKTNDWTAASNLPNPGSLPKDGSRVRNMIVFADSQVSAWILFMLLFTDFGPRVEYLYIHSGQSVAERAPVYQRMQSPVNPADTNALNKIMISTYELSGKGHNLQRANYCILMEVPISTDVLRQAAGRVDRQGEDMTPIIVKLWDGENFCEVNRINRSRNVDALTADVDISEFV